ncbi:MAG TPA: protein kinase [Kofleriaceae bacterium]|nr:protein kinase [Kofleriaceae bacterium]
MRDVGSACLALEAVQSFIRGTLDAEAADRAEEHLDGCDECRALVAALARGGSQVAAAAPAADGSQPARPELAPTGFDLAAPVRAAPPADLSLVGRTLADTYQLVRIIGKGATGVIFEARHVRLHGKRYAVKVLAAQVADDPELLARFRREAEIASQLGSENIVEVHDFNVADGRAFMVMELLEGEDLAGRIKARGALPVAEVMRIVGQVTSALDAAHRAQIVHRDLKPSNIFMCRRTGRDDDAKVLDFGLSKVLDSVSIMTRDYTLIGTPAYMAPEQAEGRIGDIDPRADVFALGAIIWEMLTGQMAFGASSFSAALYKVLCVDPPEVHLVRSELPPAVSMVLRRALAKDRFARTPSAIDVARELEAGLRGVMPAGVPPPAPHGVDSIRDMVSLTEVAAPRPAGAPPFATTSAALSPGAPPRVTLPSVFAPTVAQPRAPSQPFAPELQRAASQPFAPEPQRAASQPFAPQPGRAASQPFAPELQRSPSQPFAPEPGRAPGSGPVIGSLIRTLPPEHAVAPPAPPGDAWAPPWNPPAAQPAPSRPGLAYAGPPPRKGVRAAVVVGWCLLIVVSVATGVWFAFGQAMEEEPPSGPAPTSVAVDQPAEARAAAEPAPARPPAREASPPIALEVSLTFTVEPPRADPDIRIDGQRVSERRVRVPRSDRPVTITAEASGYSTFRAQVVPDGDRTVAIALRKTARPRSRPARAPAGATASPSSAAKPATPSAASPPAPAAAVKPSSPATRPATAETKPPAAGSPAARPAAPRPAAQPPAQPQPRPQPQPRAQPEPKPAQPAQPPKRRTGTIFDQ